MTADSQRVQDGVEQLLPIDVPVQQAHSPVPAPSSGRRRWQRRYAMAAATTDILALLLSSVLYDFFGSAGDLLVLKVGVQVVALSVVCLSLARAWDPSMLGQGSVEFTRLLRGFLATAVIIALFSLAVEMSELRPWVFAVLPTAGVFAALNRIGLRTWLHRRRRAGRAVAHVLAVGTEESVAALVERTHRSPQHGWLVTAVCTPTGAAGDGTTAIHGVPVVGDLDSVAPLAVAGGYDAVSVGQAPGWTPMRLHQLAWDLEGAGTELVVDPGLMEVAGPRLHVASVEGLPLLRLTHPSFAGFPKLLKGAFDRVAALFLLLLIWPVMFGLAVLVRSDGGPAFFRQTRVGCGGKEFTVYKFRSMAVDAEDRLAELQALNEGAGVLFKMKDDPRITRVGRFIRRYSLDELPQLFNVLNGSMSLVGPRPPLPREVAGYERAATRRLLVKPGITGLWQVSGRSDLSWEQTVRLDLRYVENWTMALDAQILIKTVKAVLRSDGAY